MWAARPRPPSTRFEDDRHSLHSIVSRICTLPPRLAGHLIKRFSKPGDRVLDPFCGKGTVALEACLLGRVGVAADISPEAVCVARAAIRAPGRQQIANYIANAAQDVQRLERDRETTRVLQSIDPGLAQFYHPRTLRGVIAWRRFLRDRRSISADFVRGVLLGILHGKGAMFLSLRCSHSYSMSPGYVTRYVAEHGLEAPSRNVAQCILDRAQWVLRDDPPAVRGDARRQDARRLRFDTNSTQLVLTSPPYFGVHRYARDNWIRLWFLGVEDYRTVQQQMIQTFDVAKYRGEMSSSMEHVRRVLVPGGYCLILVGDVRQRRRGKRDKWLKTAHLLAEDAQALGFRCEGILRDKIPDKYKVAGYMADEGGIKVERLVILRKPTGRKRKKGLTS